MLGVLLPQIFTLLNSSEQLRRGDLIHSLCPLPHSLPGMRQWCSAYFLRGSVWLVVSLLHFCPQLLCHHHHWIFSSNIWPLFSNPPLPPTFLQTPYKFPLNPKPWTLNPRPLSLDPDLQTLNPRPNSGQRFGEHKFDLQKSYVLLEKRSLIMLPSVLCKFCLNVYELTAHCMMSFDSHYGSLLLKSLPDAVWGSCYPLFHLQQCCRGDGSGHSRLPNSSQWRIGLAPAFSYPKPWSILRTIIERWFLICD